MEGWEHLFVDKTISARGALLLKSTSLNYISRYDVFSNLSISRRNLARQCELAGACMCSFIGSLPCGPIFCAGCNAHRLSSELAAQILKFKNRAPKTTIPVWESSTSVEARIFLKHFCQQHLKEDPCFIFAPCASAPSSTCRSRVTKPNERTSRPRCFGAGFAPRKIHAPKRG